MKEIVRNCLPPKELRASLWRHLANSNNSVSSGRVNPRASAETRELRTMGCISLIQFIPNLASRMTAAIEELHSLKPQAQRREPSGNHLGQVHGMGTIFWGHLRQRRWCLHSVKMPPSPSNWPSRTTQRRCLLFSKVYFWRQLKFISFHLAPAK